MINTMDKNMFLKNGLFLCLICLALQSCTAYSVLPKNISPGYAIEGVYSNQGLYYKRYIWNLVDLIGNVQLGVSGLTERKKKSLILKNNKYEEIIYSNSQWRT